MNVKQVFEILKKYIDNYEFDEHNNIVIKEGSNILIIFNIMENDLVIHTYKKDANGFQTTKMFYDEKELFEYIAQTIGIKRMLNFKNQDIKEIINKDCVLNFINDKTKIEEIIYDNNYPIKNIDEFSKQTGVPSEYILESYVKNWHFHNDDWNYFKKYKSAKPFFNELIGELISEYFELDTIHYFLAEFTDNNGNKTFGLASKNFCDKNFTYRNFKSFNIRTGLDLKILKNCKKMCTTDSSYKMLLKDIKKFFIRDYYTTQDDRAPRNFMFKMEKNPRLAPLYDYEDSFSNEEENIPFVYDSLNCFDAYYNPLGLLNLKDPKTRKILKNDYFFQKLLYRLFKINIDNILTQTEERHNIYIPEEYKNKYRKHDEIIKKKVLNYELIN